MPKIKVRPVDQNSRKPVSYVFAAFMRHCQLKNLAPYSYLYYNKNIQYFLDTENEIKYVDEICPEVIERFIGKLMDRGNKVTAINARLRAVFVFLRYCFDQEYRRIHAVITSDGNTISEKVVRRIMREEGLNVRSITHKKYNSYKGEISPEVPNIIQRDFHADKPNEKWLTDITEFHIPAGKIYLSPIIDCFDGLPVSWTIGTSPDAELVNTMLDEALSTLSVNEKPILHSDRGCHYRWPGWIERMEAAGLTRSMSKKGCSPDNSACEGFFGRLKNEMFYGVSWVGVSISDFIAELDQYIQWYAEKRIKLSLGGMSPLDYRRSLGLIVP